MSDLCIGEIARKNHGLRKKYADDLAQEYKTFIDTLEKDMLTAVYDINDNECIITKTCDIVFNKPYPFDEHYVFETAIIKFCQLHNVSVYFQRTETTEIVTIDMKLHFNILT